MTKIFGQNPMCVLQFFVHYEKLVIPGATLASAVQHNACSGGPSVSCLRSNVAHTCVSLGRVVVKRALSTVREFKRIPD